MLLVNTINSASLYFFRMALFIFARDEIQLMAALGRVIELIHFYPGPWEPFNYAFSEIGFLAAWVDECRFAF